jgi:hypothetical protein
MITIVLIVLVLVLAGALGTLAFRHYGDGRRRQTPTPVPGASRILFPFQTTALSRRALDAALRLARADNATLLPVFLARVPLTLPLDSPLPRQAATAIPLQEAIEHRAASYGVPVDARVERGRTYRHALRQTIANERFERIVIAAATEGGSGFGPDDVAWLLAHAPGEIVVLRPGAEDRIVPTAPRPERHGIVSGRRASRARRRAAVGS